jgi:hypothetical protein
MPELAANDFALELMSTHGLPGAVEVAVQPTLQEAHRIRQVEEVSA